ncbi:MAG: glutamate--cysteine ligase [Rhizobiales bacterium]|nr:glutamate--cysteine ligase [Hyphomicrobiales bacterium]
MEHRSQLVEFLQDGCKPRQNWRIGTEHEKFPFLTDTLQPVPYEGERSIRALLEGMRDRFGWTGMEENGNIIGLVDPEGGGSVSLEPGGQFELSGAPLECLQDTCEEVGEHLHQVREIGDRLGIGFLGLGVTPTWAREDVPIMPKGRYKIMREYMAKKGNLGRDMMFRSCTVQVNLDFGSEPDMVQKLRTSIALQPIATALFANSPFLDGKPNGFKSFRSNIWRDTDPDRTGMLPFVFEEGFGFEQWVDYALDVPMYFVYRNGIYQDVSGESFRDFLDGKLPQLPGDKPTLKDWADHLTTIFPEVRIKQYMEMRGADAGPWRTLCALPAFWVGLMYDQAALDGAWDLAKDWSAAERQQLRDDVPAMGLEAVIAGRSVRDIAGDCLRLARAALLERRNVGCKGRTEAQFLDVLDEIVDSGESSADQLLKLYEGSWNGDISRVFRDFAF